jgi:hypothetical protein
MKPLASDFFDKHRQPHPFGGMGDTTCGAFLMRGPCGKELAILASSGDGWDHVSVSLEKRAPRWIEMDWVKHLFFNDDEVVMQLHVAKKDHINIHPNCLHLWRPHKSAGVIPLPPKEFV